NPAILLNAVELEVTASFTQPLLERVLQAYAQYQLADLELDPVSLQQLQAQQMLQMNAMLMQAVQNGLLQQQGDRLVLQASLAAGALSVNGMPLPVPFLQ
ncbi:MAG TPA: YdgA family protein, partial [Pseudomonadaceae bacterium]|nr:YdgA family protein [Pseudomonadaceae bacterium]